MFRMNTSKYRSKGPSAAFIHPSLKTPVNKHRRAIPREPDGPEVLYPSPSTNAPLWAPPAGVNVCRSPQGLKRRSYLPSLLRWRRPRMRRLLQVHQCLSHSPARPSSVLLKLLAIRRLSLMRSKTLTNRNKKTMTPISRISVRVICRSQPSFA